MIMSDRISREKYTDLADMLSREIQKRSETRNVKMLGQRSAGNQEHVNVARGTRTVSIDT